MVKKILEKQLIIGILVGIVFGILGVRAAALAASEVTFNDNNSKLSATTLQAAIDAMAKKINSAMIVGGIGNE